MRLEKVSFTDSHSFSPLFLDYLHQKDQLAPFYSRFPDPTNFKEQIREKSSFSATQRKVLTETLKEQYQGLIITDSVRDNIAILNDKNSFTVTTGHQLNIFTGPLYFIYKIVTVINICRVLKKAYPGNHFVPVYWMASEDHDFAEISYFNLYGKKYTWQTDQQGAVGRFNPQGLESVRREVPGDTNVFAKAYAKNTLSEAVRHYVNELFGNEGLVVVDADHRNLKESLKAVIRDDIFDQTPKRRFDETSSQLEKFGYKSSVHARDINFFYLDAGTRGRLEKDEGGFKVADSTLNFRADRIAKMIEEEPEKFSPNVILRPLYQEIILPNLAYIGGPAEVCYWLQLKNLFVHYQVPFPIIMPRNFALVLDRPTCRKFKKTGLELKDLFEEKNYLFNHWVIMNSHHDLSLRNARDEVGKVFNEIKSRAAQIDKSLDPLVAAETKRIFKALEKIEHKLMKAEKRLHDDKLRQLESVKDTLFPQGVLQERVDNFLTFYQQDPEFIQKLISNFDPFDFRFNMLNYD